MTDSQTAIWRVLFWTISAVAFGYWQGSQAAGVWWFCVVPLVAEVLTYVGLK